MYVPEIILFSGKAGVGKTTSAKYLHEKYKTPILSFASGVKEVASSMGWDGLKDTKGRELLQAIGKAGRDYNPDIWVANAQRKIEQTISASDIVCVDDWRFPNEAVYLYNMGYKLHLVRIIAPQLELLTGTPQADDISETSLKDFEYFYKDIIYNLGSLENLYSHLDVFYEEIRLQN